MASTDLPETPRAEAARLRKQAEPSSGPTWGGAIDPATQSIAENSPDNIMVLDPEGRIRYINWTVPDLTREQVIGTPVVYHVPTSSRDAIEKCLARVRQSLQQDRYETSYIAADGDVSYWESRVAPVIEHGRLTGFTVNSSNVSERRRAAADRDRFFNLSVDILVVANFLGRMTRVNPACERLFGYSAEELTSRPYMDLIHPDDLAATRSQIERLGSGEVVIDFENRMRCRDGTFRTISWRSIADPDRRVMYGVGRDVTDRKTLESQVRHAQRMDAVGHLAGGIAHDFNNLVLAILGNVEFAVTERDEAKRQQSLFEIRRAAERAADLTRQLLLFSRRQTMSPVVLDVSAVIDDAMTLIRRLIPAHIEIAYEPGEGLAHIRADRSQVEQVLVNLCVNARDAMPRGGRLTIATATVTLGNTDAQPHSCAQGGRCVRMRVADTGEGMSPEIREHLFEPFFTTKDPGKGTGLGLATVYGIVQSHGGGLHVETEVGHGTTFDVYWPAAPVDAAPAKPLVDERPSRGGAETILVAEDQESVRMVVIQVLEKAGYRVLWATDGVDAVELFRRQADEIDLVLLDLVMPRMGGREAFEQICAMKPAQSVLFTSGYSDEESRAPVDVTKVLQKPYRPHQLLDFVRTALDDTSGR